MLLDVDFVENLQYVTARMDSTHKEYYKWKKDSEYVNF
jgi:hypothetical protein